MTGKFIVSGQNTTIAHSWTALTAVMQSIVGGAAEYFWNNGLGNHGTQETPILFSSLTNQQKLDILDEYFKRVALDAANTNKSIKAQEAARSAEKSTEFSL